MSNDTGLPRDLENPLDTTLAGMAGPAGMYGCVVCGAVFVTPRELQMHITAEHKEIPPHTSETSQNTLVNESETPS
jgi:hypothetical protein